MHCFTRFDRYLDDDGSMISSCSGTFYSPFVYTHFSAYR